jgi:hypothetical protein
MPGIRRRAWPVVQRALHRARIDAFVATEGYHYVPDIYGHAAAKRVDIRTLPVFGDVARRAVAGGRTLLYYDRLHVLFQALAAAHRPATPDHLTIAVVGVFRGGTLAFLGDATRALGAEPILHGFDTFTGHDTRDADVTGPHTTGRFADTDVEGVRAHLAAFPDVTLHVGRVQDTFDPTAGPFDLVHLDTDLYEPTAFGLRSLGSRLSPYGAIVVDDYGVDSCPGVVAAVQDFLVEEPSWFALQPLTEQCVLLPRPPAP